ncbi:MAG: L-malate glycosyltransferase [Verrucomicrobiota bacterium]|jgi:glycosyltransferase involved in cell wall biosynthesis
MSDRPAELLPAPLGSHLVWCVDSPGWGGSEKDLIRVFQMTRLQPQVVVCAVNIASELERFLIEADRPLIRQSSRNSWRGALVGIYRAFRLIMKYPRSVFVIWAHHHDSNRWLQVILALFRRRFLLVERLVATQSSDFARSRLSIPLKRFVARRATIIILNAHSQVEHYRDLFGLGDIPIAVISNSRPIDSVNRRVHQLWTDRLALRRSLKLSDGPIVLCVGRLDAQKDQATLIRALALLPRTDAQLVLVGDGPDREILAALAAELAPARVLFTGYQADPIPWLAAADIFVLPSIAEGLPGALIEAMAAELPSIATDIPGNCDLVLNGKTGLLVETRAPEALARAIDLLSKDKAMASDLAAAGLRRAREQYTEDKENAAWQRVFRP